MNGWAPMNTLVSQLWQCAGHLECFQRASGSNVTIPGCYGLGLAGADYCFDRADMVEGTDIAEDFTYTPTSVPTYDSVSDANPPTSAPTGEGTSAGTPEGTDAGTEEGTHKGTDEGTDEGTVPLVTGDEGSDEEADSSYYYSNVLSAPGCSSFAPCNACEGDCDYDYQVGLIRWVLQMRVSLSNDAYLPFVTV